MNHLRLKNTVDRYNKRSKNIEKFEWWNQLNYAQKFSVTSLFQFGYDIDFIRTTESHSVVIMSLNDANVTVNQDGLIDTQPNIQVRRNIING